MNFLPKRWEQYRKYIIPSGLAIAFILLSSAAYFGGRLYLASKQAPTVSKSVIRQASVKNVPDTATPAPAPPTEEAKKVVSKEPPKYTSSKTGITSTTKKNNDGSETIIVSEGQSDPACALQTGSTGSNPSGIKFSDETGKYAYLEADLKDYIASQLRRGNEVGYLYEIVVRDAGNTGWSGQYGGCYTIKSGGDIVSAYGKITLNVFYYQSSPIFADYMKVILSHEYGHHYTLYHKWVDLDLPVGTRFPDSYYSTRPLSKNNTATDYSLGWGNSEVEIIAEDYSYLYSGYGIHAMKSTHGLPSDPGTRNWLNDLTAASASPPAPVPVPAPAPDNPPTVSITEPTNGATVSGSISIKANASDDKGVSKVVFYVGPDLIVDDTSAPYEASLPTSTYPNASYILKAIAYDIANQSAESSTTVIFANDQVDNESPSVTIMAPETNPYDWSSEDLVIQAKATDNVRIVKMEFLINDSLVAEENNNKIIRRWPYATGDAGSYKLTAKAYDAAGNVGEASITINKS